jgi:hypothetical protein
MPARDVAMMHPASINEKTYSLFSNEIEHT